MSILYFFNKFSQEAMFLELLCIGLVSASWFLYYLIRRRRYGVATQHIPDNVVRALLAELLSQTQGFKNQLFGESFSMPASSASTQLGTLTAAHAGASAGSHADAGGPDAALLKNQLLAALTKQEELGKAAAQLQADKTALEQKLAQMAAAGAAGAAAPAAAAGGPADSDLLDKIAKLEAKLAEYAVIEDDLANLKKYQQENKQLKDQLASQGGSAAPTVTASAPAAEAPASEPAPVPPPSEPVAEAAPVAAETAPASEPTPPPAAEPAAEPASPLAAAEAVVQEQAAAQNFETLVDKVEESLQPAPEGASASDPQAAAKAQTAPAAADTTAAAVPAKSAADKSDADLLQEFEKMLNS